jgi:hypothetical protein
VRVFIVIALFILSHLLLPTHWQAESGQQSLSWEYAKADLATAVSFQPSLTSFDVPTDFSFVFCSARYRQQIKSLISYKINRPIYVLLGSFLL